MDRRTAIGGALALGILPAGAFAARRKKQQETLSPEFTHGVASGEPGQTSMLFWTRHMSRTARPQKVRLQISEYPDMRRAKDKGEAMSDPARDWTLRIVATDLSPGTVYYYRFLAEGGASETGRTRTLPDGYPDQWRIGVGSCSSATLGWFNAFAHALRADDLDLFVHLGNYLHVVPAGTKPVRAGLVTEPRSLDEYWEAYRSLRADADLRALHARVPVIANWGSHASGADRWLSGGTDTPLGDAQAAVARRAFADWMPVSDAPFQAYAIGRLAMLYRLDTEGRDPELKLSGNLQNLATIRDEQWVAGNRQMLGYTQERWLLDRMVAAGSQGIRWQILAQQPMFGRIAAPLAMPPFSTNADVRLRTSAGLPLDLSAWDGYPAARARLMATAQRSGCDLVVLSGGTHNSWANDLAIDGRPAGVEFGCPSVTVPGLERVLGGASPVAVEGAFVGANPLLRWSDVEKRGYMHLTVSRGQVVGQWRFTPDVATRADTLQGSVVARTLVMQRRLALG